MFSEEPKFTIQSGNVIYPASITLVQSLDFNFVASGSVVLSGSADVQNSVSYSLASSWRIDGFSEKTLLSSWSVGEGEYYWYRVETICAPATCDEIGLNYDCEMTTVNVVPARNLQGVCDALKSPRINAPVNGRVISIKKYSRPVAKANITLDQCNELIEQDYCHIPECLDYCVDESVVVYSGLDMEVLDFVGPHTPTTLLGSPFVTPITIESLEYEVTEEAVMSMSVFALGPDLNGFISGPDLTSADAVLDSVCGCSFAGQSLLVRHNLKNSDLLSKFLNRNGLDLSDEFHLRYRDRDDTWTTAQHLSATDEEWKILLSLSCLSTYWKFQMSIQRTAKQKTARTNIIVDVPNDFICYSNNISTDIRLDIYSKEFNVSSGKKIMVVTPLSARSKLLKDSPSPGVYAYFNGSFNESQTYYDNVGIFKDSNWNGVPFEININPPKISAQMPTFDVQAIFT